jgi:hypothetical protein
MALAFGATLGTGGSVEGTSTTLTTGSAVPAGGLIVTGCGFYKNDSISSATVSGGGLTWQADKFVSPFTDTAYVVALNSAAAPSGLASGTTLTVSLVGDAFAPLFAAVYFTGAATSSWLDLAGAGSGATSASWTTSVTTTNADDVVVGFVWTDGGSASEGPGAGWTEDADFTGGGANAAMVHQIFTTTGAKTPNGTLSASGNYAAVAAAYKSAAGGGGVTVKKLPALGVG